MGDAYISVVETSLGSPFSGPFQPNEEIHVELVVLWNGEGCNWLHGLTPSFGNGWSPSSFDANGTPEVLVPLNFQSNSQGNPGQFLWYQEGDVYYKYSGSAAYEIGESVPAGWYSSATSPGVNNPNACLGNSYLTDPNCSCGITQTCNTFYPHHMTIKLITGSQEDCDNGLTDLSINFKIFSDFETGSGLTPICADVPIISAPYQMACSIPEDLDLSPQELDIYSDGNLEIDFTNFVAAINPEVSYQWKAEAEEDITGASNCLNNCGTILSHQLINENPAQTKTVAYQVNPIRADGLAGPTRTFLTKVHPAIALSTSYDDSQTVCSGVTEVVIESTVLGGAMEDETIDYQYLWSTGNPEASISVYPEETTTYELTVTDQLGTTQTSSVTIEVVPTPVLTWSAEIEPSYCVGETYIFCVDPVEENTDFNWNIKDATVTSQEETNCVSVVWEEVVTSPYICVQYTNDAGCPSNEICQEDFELLDETECLVANNDLKISQFELFPNPSSQFVTIEGTSLEMIKVADSRGQLLWSKKLSGIPAFQLEVHDLPNGIYYLMINETEVRKLVVLR